MHIKIESHFNEKKTGGAFSPEDRINYFKLVDELTSRDPHKDYDSITIELLKYLKREALEKIDGSGYSTEIITKMKDDLEFIFSNINHSDTNYIGRINIVSLQIIILFTERCIGPGITFKTNLREAYKFYLAIHDEAGEWKIYDKILQMVINSKETTLDNVSIYQLYFQNRFSDKQYTTSLPESVQIDLIIAINELTLEEINMSLLQGVVLCGFESKISKADGLEVTPFEFFIHDMSHGANFQEIVSRRGREAFINILSFYKFCLKTITNTVVLYSINFMIFMLIHETGLAKFFPYGYVLLEGINITDEFVLNELTTEHLIKRYKKRDDLYILFPPEYRKRWSLFWLKTNPFLVYSTDIYLLYIEYFVETLPGFQAFCERDPINIKQKHEDNIKLFKSRIMEITGIPEEDLLPKEETATSNLFGGEKNKKPKVSSPFRKRASQKIFRQYKKKSKTKRKFIYR